MRFEIGRTGGALLALGLVLALTGGSVTAATTPQPDAASDLKAVELGRGIAEVNCAVCHALGRDDTSPMVTAPAFRDLWKRYPVEQLEESLAEGIVAGHENMPELMLEPDEINAFVAYLKSLGGPIGN